MTQSFYAPPNGINSKEYLLLMENPNPLLPPYKLESHTLGSVTQNLTDPLVFKRTKLVNGKMKTFDRVARPAEETSRTYTLGFPFGALQTPALQRARQGGCETNFFMSYLCPANPCFEHFYVYVDAQLDEPVDADEIVTVDDVVEVYETTTLHTVERLLYMHVSPEVLTTVDLGAGTGTLQAIHAAVECCPDCGNCVNRIFIGGNDGAALSETSYMALSTDRGATFTEIDLDTLTGGATSSLIVTDINSDCSYIWATLADVLAAPTAGVLVFSQDGGTNFTSPAAPTAGLFTTFAINDIPHVAGAGGEIWRARDGVNWEQVPNSVTTETLLASAVDEEEGVVYIVGTNGAAVVYDGSTVVDVSAPLAALTVPPGDLTAALVLSRNRLQVSGAAGFIAESTDGAETWTPLSVAGTANSIDALAGDQHRVFAAESGNLYNRDILTDLQYLLTEYAYSAAPTGDIVQISPAEDHNAFFAAFTTGEVMKIFPCWDDYCADQAQA
jgi:photosystem II stability/assembly factor-like uncharacterized protein